MTILVYALTSRGARVAGTGLAGERLRLVTAGQIGAVVGAARRIPRPARNNLIRYARVQARLSQDVPALIPARFGTSVVDEAELAVILRSRQRSIRLALRHVRLRVQLTIRIAAGEPAPEKPARITFAERPTGAEFLRQRAESVAAARRVEAFEPVRAAVTRWVRDERVERHGKITTIHHLVPRGSVTAYRSALFKAAGQAGLRFLLSGPFPAYAFSNF